MHSNKILLSLRHCPKVALKICGILLVGDACQGRMFFHYEVFSVHNGIREFQQQKCIHGNMRLYIHEDEEEEEKKDYCIRVFIL